MKKAFEILTYIAFFAAVVSFIVLIIAHFGDATPLGTSPRAVAGFSFLCLVWVIVFNIMEKRVAKE